MRRPSARVRHRYERYEPGPRRVPPFVARSAILVIVLASASAVLLGACSRSSPSGPDPAPATSVLVAPSASASAPATSASAPLAPAPSAIGCPEGMVRVSGEYCPSVEQRCVEHHPEWEKNHDVSERCLRFEEPSRCLSKERVRMSFCIDRWEYPNREGELPWVLTSWRDAVKRCGEQEKRLCTEEEWNFACEGPEMLPHVYGYARDDTKCNIDKPYRKREGKMRHYEKCLADPRCAAAFAKLDQRHKIGEDLACASWAGAYDMNGNVNEWVELKGKEPPDRSGLKGGWWGPVRNRCRPTVTFHKEEDYGYEAGFRCCKNGVD